jgi:hypothetical protein
MVPFMATRKYALAAIVVWVLADVILVSCGAAALPDVSTGLTLGGHADPQPETSISALARQPTEEPPVITLVGDNPLYARQGCPFIDPEATATDAEDGDLTNFIKVEGSVNINVPGQYFLTYSVEDSDKLWDAETRQVIVFGVIGTTTCLSAKPEGKAPNLVVIVHGCCMDANDVYLLRKKFGDAIKQAFLQNPPPEPWEIVVWDWHKDEITGVDQTPEPQGLIDYYWIKKYSDTAYTYTGVEGLELADAINQYPIYKHIHLIAHSAGSNLIDQAAKKLAEDKKGKNMEKPFIHLTFLDAYTPDKDAKDRYGSLPNDYLKHYSEHYVDKGFPFSDLTDETLPNAFNFNITDWIGMDKSHPLLFGHLWPLDWYVKSITAPQFNYGFPLSFEGGNNQFTELDQKYPPGQQCSIRVATGPCVPQ